MLNLESILTNSTAPHTYTIRDPLTNVPIGFEVHAEMVGAVQAEARRHGVTVEQWLNGVVTGYFRKWRTVVRSIDIHTAREFYATHKAAT
jgi:hypothetical protein